MAQDVILSIENISSFIKYQEKKNLKAETIKGYERNLMSLFNFLPNNKKITKRDLERWVSQMADDGLSISSINHRISTCNNYLIYIKKYDLHLTPQNIPIQSTDDMLTRDEYKRLLSTAKIINDERCYCLIRTIGSTGICISDIDKITVEFLLSNNNQIDSFVGEPIRFPQIIKEELLKFAKCEGIYKGPIFVSKSGVCCDRSTIYRSIVSVCFDARVPKYKATPVKLRQFYLKAYNDTIKKFRNLIDKTYDDLIESEQVSLG